MPILSQPVRRLFMALCALLLWMLTACHHLQGPGYTTPARTEAGPCEEAPDALDAAGCARAAFVQLQGGDGRPSVPLAFFEFNQDRAPAVPALMDANLQRLDELARPGPGRRALLMVLFVHGWNHNALQGDQNVQSFKQFLRQVQADEERSEVGQRRQVVGLYLGWPGQASTFTLRQLLSYRQKKDLSLGIGAQAETQRLLARLGDLRGRSGHHRLVMIGHSFGGGLLYQATEAKLINALQDHAVRHAEAYGDVILLVNPAIEARRLSGLFMQSRQAGRECSATQLVAFTSEGDTALGGVFTWGMRLFYGDRDANDTTAVGRAGDLLEYHLGPVDPSQTVASGDLLDRQDYREALSSWTALRAQGQPFAVNGLRLERVKTDRPFFAWPPLMNVQVDRRVIQEHGEIWDPSFSQFVRAMVGMQFSRSGPCARQS